MLTTAPNIPSTHTQALTRPPTGVIPHRRPNIGLPSQKCQKGKAILAQISNNLAKVRVITLKITGQLNSNKVKNDLNVSLPLKDCMSQPIINPTLIFASQLHCAWSEKAAHKGI